MIAGGGIVKVSTETLVSKADEVKTKLDQMQTLWDTIETTVNHTKGYWLGEAAELHRQMYEEQKESIAEIMKRLNEHPVDLKQMAGVYSQAEAAVKSIAESLPADILT